MKYPTPLVSVLYGSIIPIFLFNFCNCFFILSIYGNNLLEYVLYGDIEIVPCYMHAEVLKKMVS